MFCLILINLELFRFLYHYSKDISVSFTYEHVVIIKLSVSYLSYKMSYKSNIHSCLESEFILYVFLFFSAFLQTRSYLLLKLTL